jgi:hypothetical protein
MVSQHLPTNPGEDGHPGVAKADRHSQVTAQLATGVVPLKPSFEDVDGGSAKGQLGKDLSPVEDAA